MRGGVAPACPGANGLRSVGTGPPAPGATVSRPGRTVLSAARPRRVDRAGIGPRLLLAPGVGGVVGYAPDPS